MSWLFGHMEKLAFHDKSWKRADLAPWDERWAHLSAPARRHLLESVKGGIPLAPLQPPNPMASIPAPLYTELRAAGMISLEEAKKPGHFVVAAAAAGWLARLRALRRYGLLSDQPSQFDRYLNHTSLTFDLGQVVAAIVEKQTGIGRYLLDGNPFELFVRRSRWPEWVADYLAAPLARPLLEAIEQAPAPVPLSRLVELLPGASPEAVRTALDGLVTHLALFEDLQPETLDIVVGLLPEVARARRAARDQPPARLEPGQPVEVAPESGIDVPDLRTVLLEVAGSRPRLRLDGSLFQKEQERFLAALEPMPAWLFARGDEEARSQRLASALRWGHQLGLVQSVKGPDRATVLDLTASGQEWLGQERESQYAVLFAELRDADSPRMYPGPADATFLGSAIHSVPAGLNPRDNWCPPSRPLSAQEKRPLRESLHALFASLPLGTFVEVQSLLAFASHAAGNPLLLGRAPSEVVVRADGRLVPPLEEHLQEVARALLRDFLHNRLTGLGCLQVGRDSRGRFLVARLPRLDAYFGKGTTATAAAPAPTRVVVQPDFTIIVIGLDAAPVADLAPFCDRVRGSASAGSLTFRLSRPSLFRGLAGGLNADEVLARLRKHVSNELPANVLTEVETWCGQARSVDVAPATLVRCPDTDTAGRGVSALGKMAQRVGEKVVALDTEGITPGVRQKLQAAGILLGTVKEKKK